MIRLIKESHTLYKVVLPNITIWFSYETPIAFTVPEWYWQDGKRLTITKNIWSSTTGKHLNMINDDKSIRIENNEFNKLLDKAVE